MGMNVTKSPREGKKKVRRVACYLFCVHSVFLDRQSSEIKIKGSIIRIC